MNSQEISAQLQTITSEDLLQEDAESLIEAWSSQDVGIEAVEPVLMFMEAHPDWDFGLPGPFVHYVEKFYKKGYEQILIESLKRFPIQHTVWMLNRVINGEKDAQSKDILMKHLVDASAHALASVEVVELANELIASQKS